MAGGQATPPVILEPFAKNATACSPAAPVPGGKTSPFPQASQIDTTEGAASLDDGFVPLNMTDLVDGGVPPFGVDMNGILFLLSSHVAALAAGQLYVWSATLSTFMEGYAVGAVVQQAADPNAFWVNTVAGNTEDPDSGTPGGSGWWSTKPLNTTSAPTAGTHNDLTLVGASDEIHDVSTAAGNIVVTGFVAQRDGQRLLIRKTSSDANTYTLESLTGSAAANQMQLPGNMVLAVQYQTIAIRWNATVDKWVLDA